MVVLASRTSLISPGNANNKPIDEQQPPDDKQRVRTRAMDKIVGMKDYWARNAIKTFFKERR